MSEPRHIHVIGAGMAGLSAALQLSHMGEKVTVYEAAPYAGGRCRSYYDREMDCRLDNGNHLVLSGNAAIQDYLFLTRATQHMHSPAEPLFPFMDLKSGERWTVRMNNGRLPWWIFDPKRRVAGTGPLDYLSVWRVLTAGNKDTVAACLNTKSAIYRRFWEPLAVASLNTEPESASARLLGNLLAQSFMAGGTACRPMVPTIGLSESFVMPCLNTLRQHGVEVKFGKRVRSLKTADFQINSLVFGDGVVELHPLDWVVLAVPPWVAQDLIPGLKAPNEFRAIVNAHYRVETPHNPAGFTGLVGGVAEWVFVKPNVVSVTISAAERYEETDQRNWAVYVWRDLAKLFDLDPAKVPPWRIVQ
ncbi:MAG: hydroxysqualene dehydroxylase HpnE, partial [Alphaproteobacteria bacterium]|nr:hydroxysqualene dehydroxylase HpnE [Alphaproteobacteria bacterium]